MFEKHANVIFPGCPTRSQFGLIVSSPYLRCAQTASRIAQVLKVPIQFDLDLGEVFDRASMVGNVEGPQHRGPAELELQLKKDFPDVVFIRSSSEAMETAGEINIAGNQQTFPEDLLQTSTRLKKGMSFFWFQIAKSLKAE